MLTIAAQDKRILVTHDRKTMPKEFGEFIVSRNSYGVIVIAQHLPVREAINGIIMIWEVSTAEEWLNQIMTLPL
ncbi:hypothetical protein D082_24280 [Synechocystis sp. PCC 6714]|nr:hypothetical protein D082_24280 [Synechocystis sp. PCC 6714]